MAGLETLKRTSDFDRIFRSGRSQSTRELTLLVYRKREPRIRVGFCISRKLGTAVVRNRLRRRLKEVCRRQLAKFPPRWDLIILARAPALKAKFQQLEASLLELLQRAQSGSSKTSPAPSSPAAPTA